MTFDASSGALSQVTELSLHGPSTRRIVPPSSLRSRTNSRSWTDFTEPWNVGRVNRISVRWLSRTLTRVRSRFPSP